jgi:CreA protein
MKKLLLGAAIATLASVSNAEVIGSVDTTFRLIGTNDTVTIERFDDPKVENASCYVSYAKTGGVAGWAGLAEDPSRFSIACRATGPIRLLDTVGTEFEEVFSRDTSILFKEMRVSRMLDTDKNVLVYLVWSTKLIDGSPFNSVTAIPIE